MSLNRKARRQFESKTARRTKVIGAATAGSVVATQAALMSPASALTISTVTNCNDSGVGSLRDAITGANADGDLTRIVFDLNPSCSVIGLTTNLPEITASIDIQGPGADVLTIVAPSATNVNLFYATADVADFTVSGLTLDGAGISHSANGVALERHDVVDSVTIKQARAEWSVLYFAGGEGNSTVEIRNSTFTDNVNDNQFNASGQLLYTNQNQLTFSNNTVIDNSFAESMLYANDENASVSSNTFIGNEVNRPGGSFPAFYGAYLFGNLIVNTTLGSGPMCDTVQDLGANLFDDADDASSCSPSPLPTTPQSDGASASISAADLQLGSLGLHGGHTETVPLNEGSIAIDYYTMNSTGIDSDAAIPGTDQRGGIRPAGNGFDVGAYEADAEFSVEDNTSGGATCTEKKLGTIRFAPYSAKLSKKSKKLIRAYVAKIKDSGCTTIELSAHTATTTGAAKSLKAKRIKLSKARNAAVQKYLTKQLKAAGVTVTFKKHALGAKNPVKSNKTGDGRAKNRRVVVVMKALNGTL